MGMLRPLSSTLHLPSRTIWLGRVLSRLSKGQDNTQAIDVELAGVVFPLLSFLRCVLLYIDNLL